MAEATTIEALRPAALRYLADQALQYLLQVGEPSKTGQITGFIGEENPVSGKVVRDALTLDDRFIQHDRRWDLASRDVPVDRPFQRLIQEIVSSVGRPVSVDTVGVEVSKVTGISPEAQAATIRRLVKGRPHFCLTEDDRAALSEWLLDLSKTDEADVVFRNFDHPEDAETLIAVADSLKWSDPIDACAKVIEKAGCAVSGKALAFLAWRAKPEGFDPVRFYEQLVSSDLVLLSDQTFLTKKMVKALESVWDVIADEPPVEGAVEEATRAVGDISVRPVDMEEVIAISNRTEGFVTVRQMLEQVFEVSQADRDYTEWESTLSEALQNHGELLSVGWDRWRRVETIPTDILDAPASLNFQTFSFLTMEGEELELELTEDGLDGDLKNLVRRPMAAKGGECITQTDGSLRCTTTVLNHESGVLPIGGDPPPFPTQPPLLEGTIVTPEGRIPMWINNNLELAFGLESIYARLPESGGVFFLRPTNRPGDYTLELSNDLDSVVGINDARLKELRAIAERPNFNDISSLDLLAELLETHRKGASFFTLLSEMWMIRRISARMVASLLSGYYCFKHKSGLWTFDARELDKGFKKAKRKYVIE